MTQTGHRATLPLLCVASLALGFAYQTAIAPQAGEATALHRQIVAHTAPAPYRYRILMPLLAERVGYPLADLLAIAVTLFGLYAYLRRTSPRWAWLGVLYACLTLPVGFRDHYLQPWSLLEPGLLALGLLALLQRRWPLVAVLATLACLNRETGGLLVLAAIALALADRDGWPGIAAAAIPCAFVLLGLRVALGSAPATENLSVLWALNTRPDSLLYTLGRHVLQVGILWMLAAFGWRRASPELRAIALVAPAYVLVLAPFAVWWEVRLLWSLYPLLLPLALAGLERCRDERTRSLDDQGLSSETVRLR